MRRTFWILGAALLWDGIPALEVPLTVEEPAGVPRKAAAVSSGICFPRGSLKAGTSFALFRGSREIPLQVSPLVVERDGTLRWALLDFQIDLGARERVDLVLRTGAGSLPPARGIEVAEGGDAVSIDTGPLRFAVSRAKPFSLFDSADVKGTRVLSGGALDLVDGKTGRRFLASRPERISFEYRGPLRVTLRIDGDFRSAESGAVGGEPFARYTARITAWAGSAALRAEHILSNSNSQEVTYLNLRCATIWLRHGLGGGAEGLAGAGALRVPLEDGKSLWLHQGKVNRYYGEPIRDAGRAGVGEKTLWTGADSGGWIALRKGGAALFFCDRDFLGDPPRRLLADGDSVAIEYVSGKFQEGRGVPFSSDHLWLYDLSHKTLDLWIDLEPSGDFDGLAGAARGRLLAFAPPSWYARCDVFGTGKFGTLEEEKEVYRLWGWKFDEKLVPKRAHEPHAFVRWEDNHYESEADSPEGLLLMAARTGERGYFDEGEAWARYHANLHAWRTDGWTYEDGAIWFPQGGPLGTKPSRRPASIKYQAWDKGTGDDRELWHLVQGKACYCHFYGAGLVDHFLLTGSRDSLEAAVDLAEQKGSEFRKHREFTPGKTTVDDTRGFGRGFYVLAHLLEALPGDPFACELARLCRDVLWNDPNLDERGFAPCHIGTGFGGFDRKKDIPPEMAAFLEREGISMDEKGWLADRAGTRWPVVCLGGTWQHAYIQAAACRYSRISGDEDMADFADGFGRFAARFLLSEKCKQVHYYAYMDVPRKGEAWDPWKFEAAHAATADGEGCEHEGWYTRFFPDAMAISYSLSGAPGLLERARDFWHYGSKRGYRTKGLSAGWDRVGEFLDHHPPKDDTVLSASRTIGEWAHPRTDRLPPGAVRDLEVSLLGDGKALVRFTAPSDPGGGRADRYQVKCAALPIVPYEEYDFARDDGKKRNFWRAGNLSGEPRPAAPGSREEFTVSGVPSRSPLHFVVVSYDGAGNRSGLSNAVEARSGPGGPRGF